ncbi:Nn.00g102370.m01.CDS01 [Neocucurbitaria sp. VM-36]
MAAIVELPPPAPSIHTKHIANNAADCPTCGTSVQFDVEEFEAARKRILELEAQMELLKEKATAAVDKCADYEDQIRSLQAVQSRDRLPRSNTSDSLNASPPSDEPPRPATAGATTARQSRFSFLTARRTSPNDSTSLPPPPPPKDPSYFQPVPDIALLNELERERALRAKAEARAQKVDSEIEELSVQLFSQANEMVADERRARAKLEERVELLERRDREKMGRLERLEKAVSRIDRVKAMLKDEPVSSNHVTLAPPARK